MERMLLIAWNNRSQFKTDNGFSLKDDEFLAQKALINFLEELVFDIYETTDTIRWIWSVKNA